MLPRLLLCLSVLSVVTAPALAKVLAEGKPSSGGYFWQKLEKSGGSIQYVCRKKGDGKIHKDAQCNGARAEKPK